MEGTVFAFVCFRARYVTLLFSNMKINVISVGSLPHKHEEDKRKFMHVTWKINAPCNSFETASQRVRKTSSTRVYSKSESKNNFLRQNAAGIAVDRCIRNVHGVFEH